MPTAGAVDPSMIKEDHLLVRPTAAAVAHSIYWKETDDDDVNIRLKIPS